MRRSQQELVAKLICNNLYVLSSCFVSLAIWIMFFFIILNINTFDTQQLVCCKVTMVKIYYFQFKIFRFEYLVGLYLTEKELQIKNYYTFLEF